MKFKRCYGCMRELDAPGSICPRCGYDNTTGPEKQPGHALPCGTVLGGRYVIGRVLGQGGFGITYVGWNLTLEIPVCIKEYFPDGAAMRSSEQSQLVFWGASENAQSLKQSRESFVKEARKAVKLSALPSVVKVWDVFYENETAYIVMNYIEGETLKSRLVRTQKTLGEKECVELLAPVIRDLEKAHKLGIIHRDIKPDNLMLDAEGELNLLDMGAAKDLAKAAQNGGAPSSTLVVSQGFSPMEQYSAKGNIGPWTDVYAMCATIYYCVTGRLLPTPMDRLNGEAVSFDGLSASFAAALEKGLAIQADARFQTIGELLDALTEAVKNPNAKPKPIKKKAEPQNTGKTTPETPKKKNRLVPALAVAAALLIAVGVYFMKGRQPDIVVTPPPNTDVTAVPTSTPTPTPTVNTPEPMPEPTSTAETAAIDADALYDEGAALREQEDYEGAMSTFLEAAEAGSDRAMNALGELYEDGLGTAQDYETAFSWYKKAADLGNADAMANIGWLYHKGYGVEQSYDTAIMWYNDAANAGSMSAVNNLGWLYRDGLGVEQDYARALQYFTRAADAGFAAGMNNLGNMYMDGDGVDKDLDMAAEWFTKAVDTGSTSAMQNMGRLYAKGYHDYDKALEWYLKAEEAGDDHAAYMIATMYHYDLNEYDKAVEWYNKGIEAGDCHALVGLGRMYEYGQGVEENFDKAVELFSKGIDAGADYAKSEIGHLYYRDKQYDKALECFLQLADEGDGSAMYMIGLMYQYGNGVPVDYAKAMDWYRKAVDAGYSGAMSSIGDLYKDGLGVDKDIEKAKEWYVKGADTGDVGAMYANAIMYYFGDGVERDYQKALEWYMKAADAGQSYAMFKVGEMIEEGKGAQADAALAQEWYRKAADAGYEEAKEKLAA